MYGVPEMSLTHRLRQSLRLEEIGWPHFRTGLGRYRKVTTIALLSSWSLFAFAIWLAVYLAIVGAVVGFIGTATVAQSYVQGSGSAAGVVGALIGAVAGFGIGFALVFGGGLIAAAATIAIGLLAGAILSVAITGLLIVIEPWIMYMHGYRAPSTREENVIYPVLNDVSKKMKLPTVPQILISDTRTPGAWTHTRHIVLAKRLLELPTQELGGILGHELYHWYEGDATGLLFLTVSAMPLTLCCNVVSAVAQKGGKTVSLVLKLSVWPYLLIPKLLIKPTLGVESRLYEYQADSAAVRAGYGDGLYRALEQLRPFEQARSGWEEVLDASHPPMEYRLEAIDDELSKAAAAHIPHEGQPDTLPQQLVHGEALLVQPTSSLAAPKAGARQSQRKRAPHQTNK